MNRAGWMPMPGSSLGRALKESREVAFGIRAPGIEFSSHCTRHGATMSSGEAPLPVPYSRCPFGRYINAAKQTDQ
jgi:hypothetical protein